MEQTTKSGTPEKVESATQAAGHRLVLFITQDEGMMNMTRQEILGVLRYAQIAISELFTPATLREVIEAGENRTPATTGSESVKTMTSGEFEGIMRDYTKENRG